MKFFGRTRETTTAAKQPVPAEPTDCPHTALAPHWDSAGDIGRPEKVNIYICDGCRQQFPREEGERMLTDIRARLRVADTGRDHGGG